MLGDEGAKAAVKLFDGLEAVGNRCVLMPGERLIVREKMQRRGHHHSREIFAASTTITLSTASRRTAPFFGTPRYGSNCQAA